MVIVILDELWFAVICDCEGVCFVLAEWCCVDLCDVFSGFC
jgi:hypothetical protein